MSAVQNNSQIKPDVKEDVCIKTSVAQINASVKFVVPSKYQAAYDKSHYPRSIFHKGVENFLEQESKNGTDFKNNDVNRTLVVPKLFKNEPNAKTGLVSALPKNNEEIGKNGVANVKSKGNIRDHLNSPKLPNSITNKIYKVRHFYVFRYE